jgi:tRNA pseudouridine38-40 synthase
MAGQTKVALIIEYDGTRFLGSQCQKSGGTIQQELETALEKLTGEKLRAMLSSRTDAGVSALGQVASFRSGSKMALFSIVAGLNHFLPDDIGVRAAYRIPDSLDVRRTALGREYRYRIWNDPVKSPLKERDHFRVWPALDDRLMDEAAKLLIGTNDLASFCSGRGKSEKSTVRTVIEAGVQRSGREVTVRMAANSFLTHQVRNTVGALIRVGQGKMGLDEFKSLIEARQPGSAGPAAPGKGLCLVKINYQKDLGDYNENI